MQRKSKKFRILVSAFIVVSCVFSTFSTVKANDSKRIRVIVEVEGKSTLDIAKDSNISRESAIDLADEVKEEQKPVIDNINKLGGKVRYTFQNVINGISVEINASDIEKIKRINGVKSVSLVNTYHPLLNTSLDIVNAKAVSNKFNIKGEGTAVSIIDTGIDYNHKDMKISDLSKIKIRKEDIKHGPGKWFSDKVPYGYNFSDGNYDIIDKNPSVHGMHVAGIVGANGDEAEVEKNKAVRGVAPETQLFAMKVFSNRPENKIAYSDDIAAAIEDSVKHGADVINMSLGSDAGFVDSADPEQKAIRTAVNAGVIVVVAGGNSSYSTEPDYPYMEDVDTGNISSPGLCKEALQVASINNVKMICKAFDYDSDEGSGKVPYYISEVDPFGKLNGEFEIVDCGYGNKEDFEGKDVNGKIAFIKKGHVDYIDKKLNAQNAGASGIIVYNSEDDDSYINMPMDEKVKIPAIFINNSDGEKIKNLMDKNLKISFNNREVQFSNSEKRMSGFSSWGCPQDLSFKPEITAPGGNIYSTVNDNRYETKSGTSMASPHVAGLMALMVQKLKSSGSYNKDKDFVSLAKNLFINTAEPIIDGKANGLPYLTRQQGAGLVQMDKAIESKVIVTDDSDNSTIALKEIGNNKNFKIKLKNLDNKDVSFKIKDKFGVLTNEIYYSDNFNKNCLRMRADKVNGAKLSFDKTDITIPANGEITVDVNLSIPETTMPDIFVEGFISIQSEDAKQPSLGIPYMAFYGDWDNPRIFDAPLWDDNSFYGLETVRDLKGEDLGVFYNSKKHKEDVSPEYIAISPNGDKILDEAVPYVSFLRNAKEFKIEILDKDKNKIRDVAFEKNVSKNNGKTIFPQFSKEWAWDGKVYNSLSGKMETAKEGQYYIRLSGRIDYDGAEFQNLDIPVKLDITSPKLNLKYSEVEKNKYKISFAGEDNVGISGYYVYYDGDSECKYEFNKNESTAEISVPDNIKKVTVKAVDFAGNSISENIVNKNLIEFKQDIPKIVEDKNLVINYDIADLVDHVDIIVDNNDKFNNGKNKSYELVNLKEGKHKVSLEAYDINGVKIGSKIIEFEVKTTSSHDEQVTEDSIIKINNAKNGQSFLGKSVDLSGTVDLKGSGISLKVNGKETLLDDENKFNTHLNFTSYGDKEIIIEAKDHNNKIYMRKLSLDASPIKFERKEYFIKEHSLNIPYEIDTNDDIDHIKVSVDNGKTVEKPKSETDILLDKLFEGEHKVLFNVCDKSDNVIEAREITVNVDNQRPSVIALKDESEKNLISHPTVNDKAVSINGELNETVEYLKINNELVKVTEDEEKYVFSHNLNLTEGVNLVDFEIKDRAGNTTKYGLKILCDSTAPVLRTEPDKDRILVGQENEYELKIHSRDNGTGYSLYVNDGLVDKVQCQLGEGNDKETKYKVSINGDSSIVKIKLVDDAGNVSEKTIEFYRENSGEQNELMINRIGNDVLKRGEDGRVRILVENNSKVEKQGDIIVGLYNKDIRKMINYNYITKSLKSSQSENIETGFTIPKEGSYEVKAFVWDSITSMNPLSKSIIIEVK